MADNAFPNAETRFFFFIFRFSFVFFPVPCLPGPGRALGPFFLLGIRSRVPASVLDLLEENLALPRARNPPLSLPTYE